MQLKPNDIVLNPFGERGVIHSIDQEGEAIVLTNRECEYYHINSLKPYPINEDKAEEVIKNAQNYAFWFFGEKTTAGNSLMNRIAFKAFAWVFWILLCVIIGYKIADLILML
jgi:hypothetical protein